jgi:hypothetical protein
MKWTPTGTRWVISSHRHTLITTGRAWSDPEYRRLLLDDGNAACEALGLPPDWYKSRNYRSRVINAPREVLRESGTVIGDDVTVRVHDSTADMRYLIVPQRPPDTDRLD